MKETTRKPDTTDKIIFKSSPWKTIVVFLAAIMFFILGIFILKETPEEFVLGWVILLFGALGAVVVFFYLLRPGYLEITKRGFSIHQFGQVASFKWTDIETFGIFNGMISFRIKSGEAATMVARQMTGYDGSIQNEYKVKQENLLKILNEYKEKYG